MSERAVCGKIMEIIRLHIELFHHYAIMSSSSPRFHQVFMKARFVKPHNENTACANFKAHINHASSFDPQ